MAARRLMIVIIVLFGVSLLGAALVPVPRERQPVTGTDHARPTAPGPPRARTTERTVRATPGRPATVRVRAGDQLRLTVEVRRPGEVEVAGLGLVAYADRYAPATFDVAPFEPGTHAVRMLGARHAIARIEVSRAR